MEPYHLRAEHLRQHQSADGYNPITGTRFSGANLPSQPVGKLLMLPKRPCSRLNSRLEASNSQEVLFRSGLTKRRTTAGCSVSDVELGVEAFFVVSKSMPKLPLQVVDAARSAAEIEEAEKKDGKKMVKVAIDTRLDNR